MKYKVEIEEHLQRIVEIEAEDEVQAAEIVEKQYRNGEIVLTADDFHGWYTIGAQDCDWQDGYIDPKERKNDSSAD